jgi:predicted carbohydrate-binding protein with CBM5 and CBM33 domain
MSPAHALRRRGLAAIVLAALAAALLVALPAPPAQAHGGLTYPQTRTYACYLDGLAGGQAAGQGGNMLPTNPICKTVLAYNSYPFYTWYGDLLSLIAGQHQTIPDGKLCGPDTKFDAFNTPSTDWPTTTLVSGSTITIQYAAVVPHPGKFMQYITKDGWDPSKPLSWSDLEPAPFDTAVNPPTRTGGPTGPEYYWNAKLPTKSGRHIIFSIWERSDSPESFYNCSDVVFTGGTGTPTPTPTPGGGDTTAPTTPGQPSLVSATGTSAALSWPASTDAVGVTSYTVHNASTNATLATSTSPAASVSGLTAGTQYSVYVVAHDAAGNASGKSPTLVFNSGSAPSAACQVKFDVSNSWSGGFIGQVSVYNDSMTPLSSWELRWTFTKGEKLTQAWNSVATQTGTTVSAKNAAWNGTVEHHNSVSFGFMGSTTSTPGQPTGITLNGIACTTA